MPILKSSVWHSIEEKAREEIEKRQANAPGGPKAVEAGCLCPVEENRHGDGVDYSHDSISYFVDLGCPLHRKLIKRSNADGQKEAHPDPGAAARTGSGGRGGDA